MKIKSPSINNEDVIYYLTKEQIKHCINSSVSYADLIDKLMTTLENEGLK